MHKQKTVTDYLVKTLTLSNSGNKYVERRKKHIVEYSLNHDEVLLNLMVHLMSISDELKPHNVISRF